MVVIASDFAFEMEIFFETKPFEIIKDTCDLILYKVYARKLVKEAQTNVEQNFYSSLPRDKSHIFPISAFF